MRLYFLLRRSIIGMYNHSHIQTALFYIQHESAGHITSTTIVWCSRSTINVHITGKIQRWYCGFRFVILLQFIHWDQHNGLRYAFNYFLIKQSKIERSEPCSHKFSQKQESVTASNVNKRYKIIHKLLVVKQINSI